MLKKLAILLAFADVDLTKLGPFSLGEKDGHGVVGELLRKGFDNRRGMAGSSVVVGDLPQY